MNKGKGILLCFSIFLNGCQDNNIQEFEYQKIDNKICAVKPNDVINAQDFDMFEPSFYYANDNPIEEINGKIYKISLSNFKDKKQKYIFCLDKNEFKNDYLETRLRVELKKGKTFRQYEFINYSCVLGDKLNISKDKAFEKCN